MKVPHPVANITSLISLVSKGQAISYSHPLVCRGNALEKGTGSGKTEVRSRDIVAGAARAWKGSVSQSESASVGEILRS
jgi:hypothetical protein